MKIKRGVILLLLFLLTGIFFINFVSSLGISPAVVRINFQSNYEQVITYKVLNIPEGREVELYVLGDLAQYVKLDKDKLKGPGEFSVVLELPNTIEIPGQHRILVGAREKVDEELTAMIGTRVAVQAVLDIYVPYPGKYLDAYLSGHDANVGEPIKFELTLKSQGSEDVFVSPRIEILTEDKSEKIETLVFQDREIKSQEEIKLKKFLDTASYNPGTYTGIAFVPYDGKTATSEINFRVGELKIDIINYTKQITIDKLARFDIEVQSGWNNNIDGVFADILILNNTKEMIGFKTSSTNLIPWEKKTITGYFDTANFTAGVYDANITLTYFGKETGKTTNKLVKVEFIEKPDNMMLYVYILAGGIIILIIAIFLIIKFLKKKNAKKR